MSYLNLNYLLGLVGFFGSWEFILNVSRLNQCEAGVVETYSLGPGAAVFGGKGKIIAPGRLGELAIPQANVSHVYLRKQAAYGHDIKDIWHLQAASVYLMARGEPTRILNMLAPSIFEGENGSQTWLREIGHSGHYRNVATPFGQVFDCV